MVLLYGVLNAIKTPLAVGLVGRVAGIGLYSFAKGDCYDQNLQNTGEQKRANVYSVVGYLILFGELWG